MSLKDIKKIIAIASGKGGHPKKKYHFYPGKNLGF